MKETDVWHHPCYRKKYKPIIQKVLKYRSGTANISDDIIIYGPYRAENDKRLEKVLTTLKDRGLTLVKEKCIFYLPKLTFIGLVLWQQGIGPTEKKVEALNQAREPQNRQKLRVF